MTEKEVYWSRFAADFEEQSKYVVGKSDVDIILQRLAEHKDLKIALELGCGTGTYSKVLAREASELLATDFSEEMVNAARRRLEAFGNIRVAKENCSGLSYEDGSFDTVIMANLLHIVPEPEKALAEANRVLKTGGTIIVISYTMDGMKFWNKLGMICRYLKTWGRPSPHARTLNLATAGDMLMKHGFDISRSELLGAKSKALYLTAVKINLDKNSSL